MSFDKVKLEFILPLLAGVFCSLFLCGFLNSKIGIYTVSRDTGNIFEEDSAEILFSSDEEMPDLILEYYRNSEFNFWVISFFTVLCSDENIASAILYNCEKYNISPALAFALCWEESKFNPGAINRYNRDGSIDRGLFQLNNKSFPNIDIFSLFDIQSNANYGIAHLRYCLDTGGSEILALAMYNAGTGRVRSTGAPTSTLNYISRILSNKSKIENRFHLRLIKEEESRMRR